MGIPKVGIELIVFQGKEKENLNVVLKDCADAKYSCIETGFIFDKYTPLQIKETCAKYNLEYAAGHGGYDVISNQYKLEKIIKNIKDSGGSYIICSGVEPGDSISSYKSSAKVFNRVGKIIKNEGLTFCYHNHHWEFKLMDGIKGIHILGEETDPELVKFNIDVSWVQIGGEDPAEFIDRYKDRAEYYHFKDAFIKGEKIIWTELGKGDIKLESAYKTAIKFNPEYIIYEEDVAQIEIKKAIVESRNFLYKLGI